MLVDNRAWLYRTFEMEIRDEFSYGRGPKVKRITTGDNQGIRELILREF